MNSLSHVALLIVIAIIQLLTPAVAAAPDQPITVEPKVYTGPKEVADLDGLQDSFQ